MSEKTTPSDPVIEEVRDARRRISARFDHDPARLVAYYMEMQQQYGDRLLDPTRQKGEDGKSAA
ncbi:MAG TPA: hypothetical protein VF615_22745 [Longimicrobiaceae bacterium]|jgi:hypothetical protein